MELKACGNDECVVSGAIAIALRVSRLAGFAPLRFERIPSSSGAFRVTISRTAAIISGVSIIVLRLSMFALTLSDLTLAQMKKSLALDSKSSIMLFLADVVLTMSVTSIGVFAGRRRMRRFLRILTLVQELKTRTACNDRFEPRPWKVWVGMLGTILGGFTMILFNLVIFIVRNGGKKSMALICMYAFYLETALVIFLIMQDAILFLTVYSATKEINASISKQIQNNTLVQQPNLIHKEQEIVQYFLSVCNILDLVKESEEIILILQICALILYIFVTVYYLALNLLFSDISLESVLQVISQALWLIWHSFKLLLMIEPCHQLHEEMKNTKYLLSRLLSNDSYVTVGLQQCFRRDLHVNTLSLEIPPFSAMGIVSFGRPLLATIAGAVATYFLILIQFNFKVK